LDKKNAGVVALALIVGLLVGCLATYGLLQYSMKINNTATLKLVDIGVFTNTTFTSARAL
jgi:high-affinity Fe2+/Pb2+ permease